MCLDVECEYTILGEPGWRTARKEHRCTECNRAIEKGERYWRYALVEWGESTVDEVKMCGHCRMTIELGVAFTGCPPQWYFGTIHDLNPDDGGFVGDILVNHEMPLCQRAVMLRQVVRRRRSWRRKDGTLYPVPALAGEG